MLPATVDHAGEQPTPVLLWAWIREGSDASVFPSLALVQGGTGETSETARESAPLGRDRAGDRGDRHVSSGGVGHPCHTHRSPIDPETALGVTPVSLVSRLGERVLSEGENAYPAIIAFGYRAPARACSWTSVHQLTCHGSNAAPAPWLGQKATRAKSLSQSDRAHGGHTETPNKRVRRTRQVKAGAHATARGQHTARQGADPSCQAPEKDH